MSEAMEEEPARTEGLRERKRRATRLRIAEEGLRLFVENGYDATTLEAVAVASRISARTLFHYFKTKDEILQFWKGPGFLEALGPTLLAESADQPPLDAVLSCFLKLISRYETEKSVIVDRILNSTEALRTRKQAIYVTMEQTVFAALCELWPRPERRASLRIVAMMAIGALRLAMEAQRQASGTRSLADYLRDNFALLGR
ncbi:MAG TPA: helix-turn-helix domain-containing protein [Lichenihabitans sp.]|jgi:AcrR family transcriptional regulator|nr:helix-turn-helix domain-containing protein [Lichenihabitans sp.]